MTVCKYFKCCADFVALTVLMFRVLLDAMDTCLL